MNKKNNTNTDAQLHDSRLYRTLFNEAADAMFLIDKTGSLIQANNAFYTIFDKEKTPDLLRINSYIADSDIELWNSFLKGFDLSGEPQRLVIRLRINQYKTISIQINANSITFDDNKMYILAIVRDISEQVALEHDLKELTTNLENQVKLKAKELWMIQAGFVETIATLTEYRDQYTGHHLERISNYVGILAEELSKSSPYADCIKDKKHYIKDLVFASVLHDIGKTAIPDHILQKPAPLTEDEWHIMKSHTTIAGEILKREESKFRELTGKESYLNLAAEIICYHHEKWDGTGYPEGLSREEIPLSARITAVADVYDALTSERPYKQKWSHQEARDVIINSRSTHFDPHIVDAFLKQEEIFKLISK